MPKPTIATDEEILGEHLPYELWMLRETHEKLGSALTDQVLCNALIESFCLHARLLLEFFEKKKSKHAKDYTGGSYKAAHLGSLTKTERDKLNTQIAHITGYRTIDPSQKIGPALRLKLLTALQREAITFEQQLTADFKPMFRRPSAAHQTKKD
ncbi:MAG: hypothetical protein ABJF89_13300 [Parasphingorhabdus sp.]|uniref:hypothetical protein n=1 Tax=Parasphingorhabdus sp. TaxID=2709688 RepID=UPI0032659D36